MYVYPSVESISINRCVSYFLMSSFLYYEKHENILHDNDFDFVCKRLINEWGDITHHHKHLINLDSLKAGTGYDIKYNNRIIGAANQWYKDYLEWEKNNIDGLVLNT